MPFPVTPRVMAPLAPWIGAAAGAQLVTVPAGIVVSEYVGTGTGAYLTAAVAGLVCATGARTGARAGARIGKRFEVGDAGAPVSAIAVAAAVQVALAVALAFRLVPGGLDPLAPTAEVALTYLAAVVAALTWSLTGWR